MNRRTFAKLAGMTIAADRVMGITAQGQTSISSNSNPLGNSYLVGAAYYPEWWPRTEWEIDFSQMQSLGINTVRMGEFAWARFEPAPGKFDFAWMDEAIGIAQRHNIHAILATPTASVPPWLYQLHPDVLTGNQDGPYTYGGRKGYNTSSPNYLQASARIVTALAEHYGRNSGVIGWQLDNEPGFPFQAYDPVTEKAFQAWLAKRYGTLDELNRVWNGAFWSNSFTDWAQIRIPSNSAEGGWQPAISLDYRRFFSDSFLNHLRRQADILHARIHNQFVFTNWPSPTWSVDVYQAAEFLDATAWDNYVSAPGLSRFERQYIAGFLSDFCRCAGPRQRFLCAEQNAYVPPNADPEGLRLQAYCDLAHGAHGQLYFEWRRPLAGNEEHRPSFLKGFDGKINPDKSVLERICREMARLGPELAGATTTAEIAILYSFPNEWAQGMGGIGDPHPTYNAEAQNYYNGLKALKRNIDVVPVGANLSGYKLVAAPNLRLVDDDTIAKLKAYAAGGGALLLNDRVATQNMDNSMRRTLAPGALAEGAGVQSDAALDLFESNAQNGTLAADLESQLGIRFVGNDAVYAPRTVIESLHLEGAEAIAHVVGGRMGGQPAVTRHRNRSGWVFYAGVDSADPGFYESLAQAVAGAIGLEPLIAAPRGVEVTTRSDGTRTWFFLLNLTETAHPDIVLPRPMKNVLTGQTGVQRIALEPLGATVLAVETS